MIKNLRKIKNENGAISVLVAITILAFITILLGGIMIITVTRQTQLQSDIRIQEIYGRDVERVDEVYNEIYTGINEIKISGKNNIEVGDSAQLTATIEPSNSTYKDVVWSSSDTNVVTISDTGFINGVGAGTATITATAQDGFGTTGTINVTVSKNSSVKILVVTDQLISQISNYSVYNKLTNCFENVTYNPDITDNDLLNSNYDLYISNDIYWSTGRGAILSQLFSRGKNIITSGNNNTDQNGLTIIKSTIRYLNTEERAGRKVVNSSISNDLLNTYTTTDDANAVAFIDGAESWYLEQKNGTEYTSIGLLNGNSGNRWLHDQTGFFLYGFVNSIQLKNVILYLTGNI